MNEWMLGEILETSLGLETHIVMCGEVGAVSFHLYAWWVTHTSCSINVNGKQEENEGGN